MVAAQSPSIFVSYSRRDGAAPAAALRTELEAYGFTIWQDLVALEGGRDWWSQIEDALRSPWLQHFVLIVTPQALASRIVRREIRLARQLGRGVCPIKGPGLGDLSKLPRWLGQLYDLGLPEHVVTLRRVLEAPANLKRVPMMAPEPPEDFVARPTEFEALRAELLNADKDSVAITAALRGAGGYGKTTLAKALAHDPDVQEAYFDGILWVELGEQGRGRVITLINDLAALITGRSPQTTTVEAARAALAEALSDRRFLLVVDDVWRKFHLDPFLQGGANTTRLVTTRFDHELPENTLRQVVDGMQQNEARELLQWGLPRDQAKLVGPALGSLAARLYDWAQLLKLANGSLRDRVTKHKQSLVRAIEDAERRLAAKGLLAFDDPRAKEYEGRHKSVAAVIGLNLDLLEDEKRARFEELSIFPEDVDVPIGIVARLWAHNEEPDEFETVDLLSELYNLSLLLDLDLEHRTIRLHDTTRHYLREEAKRKGELAAQHSRLIQAMGDIGGDKAIPITDDQWETPAADIDYFYRYVPSHLADAGDRTTLDALLLDPGWLQAKLEATRSPLALVADYEQHGRGQLQNFIGRTLRLTASICARDERQLLPQLLGRLTVAAPNFVDRARRQVKSPAILTRGLSLTPPGAETTRLEGHEGSVIALCPLPDGRLASGSDDNTIRLWDLRTGAESARIEGHTNSVTALCPLSDGRLASGSYDETIRLWDLRTGAETARLAGHTSIVSALCLLPDGRLVSGSYDKTIRLWDLRSAAEIGRLEGHTESVCALCVLPDGRLASGSSDSTVRLWDLRTGAETARLELDDTSHVDALCSMPDGQLASGGSQFGIIRIWDLRSGAEIGRLGDRGDWVNALCLLPDGGLVSGYADKIIRLWDVRTGAETARFNGHEGSVDALCAWPDGRLASRSADGTIRLWDFRTGAESSRLGGHTNSVTALCPLPGGRLASGSSDSTVRLWDSRTGAETARLEGHAQMNALCLLPNGLLAFRTERTIRLWDPRTAVETAWLKSLDHPVFALCVLPDGRLASGSLDPAIRLWDARTGAETARLEGTAWLEGHEDSVHALSALPDGRLASGSSDRTIRLWDSNKAKEVCRSEVDGAVLCLAAPDGRLVAGDRIGRLHWLEIVD